MAGDEEQGQGSPEGRVTDSRMRLGSIVLPLGDPRPQVIAQLPSAFLSRDELFAMTHAPRNPSKRAKEVIVGWLTREGFSFRIGHDDWPVVSRAHAESMFGGPRKPEATRPALDMGAIHRTKQGRKS